ncbi:MAG: heavy metal-binding domain-containing protein [Neisseria sp.]|nr:heavy metal-binding domain-containing protein [Neisseria sp.]
MDAAWIVLLKTVWPLLLLPVAFVVGNILEKRHYADILRREAELHHIVVVASRFPPDEFGGQFLVKGSAVVSSDYFRRMLAAFRQIFGGNIRSYESLLDRGRREALLRMKAQAAAQGANAVFNVKIDTSSLSQVDKGSGAVGTVEVLAYGTAGTLADEV